MPTVKYSAHSGRAGRGCRASVRRGSSPGRQSCFSWGSGASRDGLPTPTVPPLPTSLSSEAGVGQGGQQRGFPCPCSAASLGDTSSLCPWVGRMV